MRRYRLKAVEGVPVMFADEFGAWVRFEDVRELTEAAGSVAAERDRLAGALARIAGVPVTMAAREVVGAARSALDRSEP